MSNLSAETASSTLRYIVFGGKKSPQLFLNHKKSEWVQLQNATMTSAIGTPEVVRHDSRSLKVIRNDTLE